MKERYDSLRRETWDMPDGKQKLALLEESILIADHYLTVEDAFDARMHYLRYTSVCGCPERMFIPFAWCLAKFEKDPSKHSSFDILWYYKWVISRALCIPQIDLEKLEQLLEDFKGKCLLYHYSLRSYYKLQVSYLLHQGKSKEAAVYYKQWRSAPRDSLSDCRACEQNAFGHYYFEMNQNKRGMTAIKPILDGGMSCQSIPQNTYSIMIYPLLKLGEYGDAVKTAGKAIQSLRGPQYLDEYSILLQFYAVTDIDKAVKLYERTIRLGLDSKIHWDKMNYLIAVRFFLRQWSQKKRRKKLPESDIVTLPWLDNEIEKLSFLFNERNGNDYASTRISSLEKSFSKLLMAYNKTK
ncbi:hypothetical protein ACFQZE_12445 [Paenibacillus sp. GCM10027627]|uniref:hypothetical protein n=1 Tax=unclassified Paenibacillus TaxID=185978 RepID=UPI00362AD659